MAKKYIDAERLREGLKELESVIHSDQLVGQSMHPYDCGQLHAINTIKEFINSLQYEQSCDTCTNDKGCVTCKDGELWEGEPIPSEDLEEAAWDCVLDSIDVNNPVLLPKYKELLLSLFIAGAEWQKDKDTRDMYMSDNRHFQKIYELGRKEQKEQMLKDAVERTVKIDSGGYPYIDLTVELYDYEHDVPLAKEGELVKIIIVKEDKK